MNVEATQNGDEGLNPLDDHEERQVLYKALNSFQ